MEKFLSPLVKTVVLCLMLITEGICSQWGEKGKQYVDYEGIRIQTLNNMGVEHLPFDPYSLEFLDLCEQKGHDMRALEIGAAYGHASLEALRRGIKNIFVNDLDARHLEQFIQKIPEDQTTYTTCVPGDFPDDFTFFPDAYFDAILAVRVFHFYTPDKLIAATKELYRLLRPQGKVYVVCESPYLNNNEDVIHDYEARVKAEWNFPGLIDDLHKRKPHLSSYMPSYIHYLDPLTLTRVFTEAEFIVEKSNFISRPDYPERLKLDGRESVGIIARKPI